MSHIHVRPRRHAQITLLLVLLSMLLGGFAATPARAAAGTLRLSQEWLAANEPERAVVRLSLGMAGGDEPARVELREQLPPEIVLAGRPTFSSNTNPQQVSVSDAGRVITWLGSLAPDTTITIDLPVRVLPCAGPDREVNLLAEARFTNSEGQVSDTLVRPLECTDTAIGQFAVQQELVFPEENAAEKAAAETQADPALVPGVRARLRITFSNNSPAEAVLGWNHDFEPVGEPTPWAPMPLAAGASRSVELPIDLTGVYTPDLSLEPRQLVLESIVTYCLLDADRRACPSPAEQADLAARDLLRIPLYPRDLGDAPDSTNHFGVAMSAYPTIPANYPTVFDPTTGVPSGPLHVNPRPFHLGRRVSLEAGADVGPDQDVIRNLVPPANNPDNDRADDGVRLGPNGLQHCRPATFEVSVFIDPVFQANLLAAGVEQGYLNLWLDFNRDGDWADNDQCPPAEGQPSVALEHIVIDSKVDIAALSAGVNLLTVTSGRISWPANLATRPAWLRATLSLDPSTKTLQAGGISYGDGRGRYDAQNQPIPFRSGETEDYLVNRGASGEADVEVRKWGKIERFDPENPADTRIAWVIEYRNRGDAPAQEVVLRDKLDNDLNIIAILIGLYTRPEIEEIRDGDTLVFPIGKLAPGAGGRIVIVTGLPQGEQLPEVMRNLVVARAANDVNPANNEAAAEVNLGLRAPLILTPGDGATCAPRVTFSGRATPGATVLIFDESGSIDSALASVTANAEGRWEAQATLSEGRNQIRAVARLGNRTSPPSEPMRIFVDPSLPFDPLSMRFSEVGGQERVRPVDPDGRTGDRGWVVYLKPNTTYRFGVRSCCEAENSRLALALGERQPIELTDPDNDGIYTGEFTTGLDGGRVSFQIIVVCGNLRFVADGEIAATAGGRIFDTRTGDPIGGAVVTLLRCNEDRECVPARGVEGNPQRSGPQGFYRFHVLPGRYALLVARPGYQPFRSRIFPVLDGIVRLNVGLTPASAAKADHTVEIDSAGFSGQLLRVRPGALVEFINIDVWEHAIVSPRDPASGLLTPATAPAELESGALEPGGSYSLQFNTAGSYSVRNETTGDTITVVVAEEDFKLYLPLLIQ